MTNPAMHPEPPLLPPHRVPNAPLDLKFSLMTPDQVRRFVREEAIAGRFQYGDLYKAAVRALGPESPEAQANINPDPYNGRRVVDRIDHRTVTTSSQSLDGSYVQYCIESRTYANGDYVTVRVPAADWLDHAPTMDEVIDAHRAAMPIIEKTIAEHDAAVAKANAEAQKAIAAAAPPVP